MTAPIPSWNVTDTLVEVRRIQLLARAAGISFTFPLVLYGFAGLVSAALLAFTPIWVYNTWWAVVAASAPFLIARHYGQRLHARGVGISRFRAIHYTIATELLAVGLWFGHPLYPIMISAPWLAFAAGAAVVGQVWRDRTLVVIAAGTCAIVVAAAAGSWPMPTTDLAVGILLCLGATRWGRPTGRVKTMLPPWPSRAGGVRPQSSP